MFRADRGAWSSGGGGGVSGRRNRNKGNTKGGNDKIGRKQGRTDISEKGSEGKTGTGLNSTPLLRLSL